MLYPRKLFNVLKQHLETKEIIVLTGMRRVGKTSIYKTLFDGIKSKNKVFLDIENPIDQKLFEELDYNNIWANLKQYNISTQEKAYIFLDEIQAMPNIVKAIKYLYDHYNVKFFLTGSSSFYLKNLFPESLAGRKFIFNLYPLDFEEFLIFKDNPKKFNTDFKQMDKGKNLVKYEKTIKSYEEYLVFGGFPQVVLEKNVSQKKLQLNDILKSYFEKDVRNLADFRQINTFRDLILLLMRRAGSKLEITKIASELGVARDTIYSYIAFLEGTFFIDLISPFTGSVDREISGTKKIFLCDTGLINQFAKIDEGSLFENGVYNNLKKYGEINYYQRRTGVEIDFIINKEIAIEAKIKGTWQNLAKLRKLSTQLKLKESYVVTKKLTPQLGFIPALEL